MIVIIVHPVHALCHNIVTSCTCTVSQHCYILYMHCVTTLLHPVHALCHNIVTSCTCTVSQHCYILYMHCVTTLLHPVHALCHNIVTSCTCTVSQHCYIDVFQSQILSTFKVVIRGRVRGLRISCVGTGKC